MGYRGSNGDQNSGWDSEEGISQSGWNSENNSQSGWNMNNSQSGWNSENHSQGGWNPNISQQDWNANNQQQGWNNGNPSGQWNSSMGGGYPGGPGKKNRGGLTKEVIIALLIAVAAVIFVAILFVVSGKKSDIQNKNGNNVKSSTQTVATTTQAATEETQATTAATTQATIATTAATRSQNTTASTSNNTYIFADSDSRNLTSEEVLGLSKWEAKIAKNEIYARHHRRFNDKSIQQYFDSQQWYSGTIAPSDFDEGVFNSYENANIELLKKAENGTLTSSTPSAPSSADDDFVIYYSSDVRLDDSDLSGLSKSKLKIARNEIYARHHRKFDSAELQNYFNSKGWYSGTISPSDFDEDSELSQLEKDNIKLIQKYEAK